MSNITLQAPLEIVSSSSSDVHVANHVAPSHSLASTFKKYAIMAGKCTFIASAFAGGFALLSVGSMLTSCIGAVLIAGASLFGVIMIDREITKAKNQCLEIAQEHRKICKQQKALVRRTEALALKQSEQLKSLHCELTEVKTLFKDVQDTSHVLETVSASLTYSAQEFGKCLTSFQAVQAAIQAYFPTPHSQDKPKGNREGVVQLRETAIDIPPSPSTHSLVSINSNQAESERAEDEIDNTPSEEVEETMFDQDIELLHKKILEDKAKAEHSLHFQKLMRNIGVEFLPMNPDYRFGAAVRETL